MSQFLAIVAYRCLLNGSPTSTLDIQVQWFEAANAAEVRDAIAAKPPDGYRNSDGEPVFWELSSILEVEEFKPVASGEEVIGIHISPDELYGLA